MHNKANGGLERTKNTSNGGHQQESNSLSAKVDPLEEDSIRLMSFSNAERQSADESSSEQLLGARESSQISIPSDNKSRTSAQQQPRVASQIKTTTTTTTTDPPPPPQDDTQLLQRAGETSQGAPMSPPNISELIGEFGLYQLSLALITLLRYVCVAMMTNTGPLLAPTLTHWCQPPDAFQANSSINYNLSDTTQLSTGKPPFEATRQNDFLKDQCQLQLANRSLYECTAWKFDTSEAGVTLTDSFNLVCDRSWLRSAFQSSVSVGVMIAPVLFGSFSDEHGRRPAMLVCSAISLLAGLVSCWAPDFLTYTLARSLCSMCDLGIVSSLYTSIVETLGNKYRGAVCLVVFTGWSMGVMVMPWITGYFLDFRQVMLFTVACHLLTLPWILTIGESVRWLLVNGRLGEARAEIRRICGWNCVGRPGVRRSRLARADVGFELLKVKYELMAREREAAIRASGRYERYHSGRQVLKRTLFGGLSKVGQIFGSRELMITTAMIIWTTFNSELLYMLFIMINSDVGENVKLNYALGGIVETLATLLSILMILWLTRRLALCSTLATISAFMLCLAFTHKQADVSVWTLNLTKLAISTLSSLVYVIVTELFPTSLRQTGMGVAGTLGSLGAVIAPFVRTELVGMIGMTNVMLSLSLLPLSAALLIPFFLRETKDVELADDVNDISRAAAAAAESNSD